MYYNSMKRGYKSNRYNISGLADATYNPAMSTLKFPSILTDAITVANRYMDMDNTGKVGTYSSTAPIQPSVYEIKGKTYVVTQFADALPEAVRMVLGPSNINLRGRLRNDVEFLALAEIVTTDKGQQQDEDCPPPENCVEKWIDKTLYVSSRPVENAIEIPVAFKKLVCEGETTDDPEVDCEELLRALQESISSGQGVNGLSAYTGDYPPDWCKDCQEKLVKASAYVTEYAVAGSKPFKVKVKVLVCETGAEPTIDCEEVIKALGAGMRGKRGRTINGLSEATATNQSTASQTATSGQEFDTEAATLDPSRRAMQAGFPWWMWLVIGGGVVYAARKL